MDLDTLPATIVTPRFRMRLLDESDLDGLCAVHGDDEVTRYIPSATWQGRDDGVAWLARHARMHADGRGRRWALIENGTERRIGDCMLFNFDVVSSRAELGFVLGRRDWGRGAMHEAAGALVAAGFDALGLRRIEAFADPRNLGSHRVLMVLGFAHEGLLRQRTVMKGEVQDANVYGLLQDEWAARRRAAAR